MTDKFDILRVLATDVYFHGWPCFSNDYEDGIYFSLHLDDSNHSVFVSWYLDETSIELIGFDRMKLLHSDPDAIRRVRIYMEHRYSRMVDPTRGRSPWP